MSFQAESSRTQIERSEGESCCLCSRCKTTTAPRMTCFHRGRERTSFTSIQGGGPSLGPTERSEGGSGCRCRELVKRRLARLQGRCRRTARRSYTGHRDNPHSRFRSTAASARQPPSGRGLRRPPWPKAPAFGRLTPRRHPSWASPSCRRSSGPSPPGT
jgi:hypothetical protein